MLTSHERQLVIERHVLLGEWPKIVARSRTLQAIFSALSPRECLALKNVTTFAEAMERVEEVVKTRRPRMGEWVATR